MVWVLVIGIACVLAPLWFSEWYCLTASGDPGGLPLEVMVYHSSPNSRAPLITSSFSPPERVWFNISMTSFQVSSKVMISPWKASVYLSGLSENLPRSCFICLRSWREKGTQTLTGPHSLLTTFYRGSKDGCNCFLGRLAGRSA